MPEIPQADPPRDESLPGTTVLPSRSRASDRWKRWLLQAAGLLCSVLAIAGVVLPLVPTTPFLLLAAACFARTSPRLHRWLLSNRAFGPYLERWQRDHTVPREAKRKAYFVVVLSFAVSIALVGGVWPRILLFALGSALVVFLARLPSTRPSE